MNPVSAVTLAVVLGISAIAGLSAIVIYFKRLVEKWAIRKIEKLSIDKYNDVNEPPEDGDIRHTFFPLANATGFLILLDTFLSWLKHPSWTNIETAGAENLPFSFLSLIYPVPFALTALLLAASAMYLHVSRRGTRKIKYDLILTAQLFYYLTATLALYIRASAHQITSASISTAAQTAAVCWLSFLALQFITARLAKRIDSHQQAVALYHGIQPPALTMLALIVPVFFIYGLARYHLVGLIARKPIFYFRSFHYRGGPEAFVKIIAKAARRFGIIEGLVHSQQLASDLQVQLDVTEQAHFYTSPQKEWHIWVLNKLQPGSVAIIDLTEKTQSLEWEIGQAVEILGSSHVAFLYTGACRPEITPEAFQLEYTLDRHGAKKARRELHGWLRNLLLSSSEAG